VTQAGLEAADLFKEAANLVPLASAYNDKRIGYLEREARALYQQGNEFGDNRALGSAIERYNRLLDLRPRDRVPLDWAMTQNNLANALVRLGERESGTARLEEAVAAYRAAMQENTRDRVPLDWAMTQNNLGLALWRLGERESGTARLEEAVAAYRAALQENTRDRVPLEWAMSRRAARQSPDGPTGAGADYSRL
jgi:tetratricopeptide (TPR) repeat protein